MAPSAVAPLYIGPLLDLSHLQLDEHQIVEPGVASNSRPRVDSDRLTDSKTFPDLAVSRLFSLVKVLPLFLHFFPTAGACTSTSAVVDSLSSYPSQVEESVLAP